MHPAEYAKQKGGSLPSAPTVAQDAMRPVVDAKPGSPRGPPLDDDAWLTSAQTRAHTANVSTMCLWRWMRDERVKFPSPVKINGRNYWRLGDLRRWQAEQAAKGARTPSPFGSDRAARQGVVLHESNDDASAGAACGAQESPGSIGRCP
jgi:predicted DNA-binding transcriptional regulator AlpA